MKAQNVGALVVLKSGDAKQLAGIVTERGKQSRKWVASNLYEKQLLFSTGEKLYDECSLSSIKENE